MVGARGATTTQEREDEQRSLLEEKRLLCALPPPRLICSRSALCEEQFALQSRNAP